MNITVKSGVKHFGPDWETLMRHKRGQCGHDEYTEIYLARMKQSRIDNPKTWARLLLYNKMAFGCYCAAGAFCHRRAFIQDVKEYIENQGGTVTIHGELTKETLPALTA